VNSIGRPDTIAQGMKSSAQGGKGSPTIARVEFLHHELQPMIGFLERLIEHVKARFAHCPPPASEGSLSGRDA
jgi:hypothetical protein